MLWLTVLMLSVFSAFAQKKSEKNVIMLAIIGLTIFELIFEARARYLYTYVPLYIVLAMYGIERISYLLRQEGLSVS
jgi:riboflavin transporter FmnP